MGSAMMSIVILVIVLALGGYMFVYQQTHEYNCVKEETQCYSTGHSFWGYYQDEKDCSTSKWDLKKDVCTEGYWRKK